MGLNDADARQFWAELIAARARYEATVSPYYDEVLHEVSATVAAEGSIGKRDLAALLAWKRVRTNPRSVGALMSLSDARVREATGPAVRAARDAGLSLVESARRARAALSPLPLCEKGDSLASAFILAMEPGRFAVYDRRVETTLEAWGLHPQNTPGVYARYIGLLENLSTVAPDEATGWRPRDLDIAMYQLNGRT